MGAWCEVDEGLFEPRQLYATYTDNPESKQGTFATRIMR